MKVMEGCVIHEGEEILFAYGKDYWDRWGDDAELKCAQVRQVATEDVQRGQEGDGGGERGGRDARQGDGAAGSSGDVGASGSGGGDIRVVQREEGLRVEDMSGNKRKRRAHAEVAHTPTLKVRGRGKMPKGSNSVQWTAVAREAYAQQQRRFERGEGGGVT